MITHLQRRCIDPAGDETLNRVETVGTHLPINLSDEFNLEQNPATRVTVEREDGTVIQWTACGWSVVFNGVLTNPDGEQHHGRVICEFYLDEDGQPRVANSWREEE